MTNNTQVHPMMSDPIAPIEAATSYGDVLL